MNPLTQVKNIQKMTKRETALGIGDDASWHAKYKESAYIYVGGLSFELNEGDVITVFAQYGEVVDINLVRDKSTGKSRGFAFLAYEDQRSTVLAVDNLNGTKILGRIIKVDHVSNYKKKEEVDEEEEQRKREARGVCRAFQEGKCSRGDSCKFSHNEQRAANTGWGPNDREARGTRYDDRTRGDKSLSLSTSRSRLHDETKDREPMDKGRSDEKDYRRHSGKEEHRDRDRNNGRRDRDDDFERARERERDDDYARRKKQRLDSEVDDRHGRSDKKSTRHDGKSR